jgi:hypothetical protein
MIFIAKKVKIDFSKLQFKTAVCERCEEIVRASEICDACFCCQACCAC